jgi:hypothetical protein
MQTPASALLLSGLAAIVLGAASSPAASVDVSTSQALCMDQDKNCRMRIIRLPDGLEGQVLKFEFCKEPECDRSNRSHWSTHYLVPPPGEVCRNSNVGEALHWIEQNRPGWLLAGWGCVSNVKFSI